MQKISSLCLVVVLAACASAQISTDYDKSVDFSRYKTYAWQPGMPAANPLTQKRIESAVDRQLAAKGFTKVASSPDLNVVTWASMSDAQQVNVDSFGYGTGFWGPSTVHVQSVDIGTVLIDLVDASSHQLVWRAVASNTVGPSVSEERINRTTEKLFARFPPAAR